MNILTASTYRPRTPRHRAIQCHARLIRTLTIGDVARGIHSLKLDVNHHG
jgi:hypothetical protein